MQKNCRKLSKPPEPSQKHWLCSYVLVQKFPSKYCVSVFSRYVCKKIYIYRILCCFPLLSFHLSIGQVLGDKFVSVLLNPHSFNACLKDATHNMAAPLPQEWCSVYSWISSLHSCALQLIAAFQLCNSHVRYALNLWCQLMNLTPDEPLSAWSAAVISCQRFT